MPWFGPANPPLGWDPVQQLRSVDGQSDLQSLARARRKNKGGSET
jgi:hypothetical protein